MTPTQKKLFDLHGSPESFEAATWKAYEDGTITAEEAAVAIKKYKWDWHVAEVRDNRRRLYAVG